MTTIDIDAIHLGAGSHPGPDAGGCIMEWTSYLAGEDWTDAPACVSPVIRQFCVGWNDALPDEDRDRILKPFIEKVIGTNTGPEDDLVRSWMCIDFHARVSAPAWMRLAGLEARAAELEALAPIVDSESARAAQPLLDACRRDSAAARAAARDAAGNAAWAAARDAAIRESIAAALEWLGDEAGAL